MNGSESTRLINEVKMTHLCSHPIRISGEMVQLSTGKLSRRTLRIACRDRRRVVCPACSYLYQGDAWFLTVLGLRGGDEVNSAVSERPRLFVTLTAPSFGRVHNERCHEFANVRSRPERCRHGRSTLCPGYHIEGHTDLGSPICHECFDYPGAILWNAHLSRLWNRTTIELRRAVAAAGAVPHRRLGDVARINFIKVAELQRRGLVHLHIVVRADGPGHADSAPPEWLDTALLAASLRRVVRDVRFTGLDTVEKRWGQQMSIDDLGASDQDPGRVANYVAKYSTKSTDGTLELARRLRSRAQIQQLLVSEHQKTLALTAWDLGGRSALEPLHLQSHAHAFGYTGQLITKSRGYSTTFAALRAKRARHTRSNNEFEVFDNFAYDGRGYDDPRSAEVAEKLFQLRHELRQDRSRALREATSTDDMNSRELAVRSGEISPLLTGAPSITSNPKGSE